MLYLLISALLALNGYYAVALPAEPFVIFSNITNLLVYDLTTNTRSNLFGGMDRVVPLGVDTVQQHIYFGEHTLGQIYRSNYDGTSRVKIMDEVENVEGVAIDWIGRKLYWTTYKSETIEVSTLDGKYRKVLINAGLEYPRGMAVDPASGYLFWSDWGAAAAIERCSLDGSNRIALVKDNITWPNGVTLDTSQKLVYWLDAYHDTISAVDYNGNGRKLIYEDTSLALSQFHGFDLDITGDFIFFTDWLSNAIFQVRISSGVVVRNVSVPTSVSIKGAMGLRVIDRSKQQHGSTNCGSNNDGCEQLCFHKVPTGTACGCQLGMKLANDQKSCEDAFKDEFIMFADADAGKIYQMQLDSRNVKPIALPFNNKTFITRPVALEYDRVEDRVYWTDVTLRTISRAFRNGTGFEVLFDNIGVADGLTIDFAGRLLYWTSTTNNTVEVSKLDGSLRRTLFKWSLDEPRDIIVDPIDGYMYWTDWGSLPRIERAHMNGENRMDLVNHTLHWPNGLTIDHVYNKLYWADAYEDNIEVMDLTTYERKVVLNQKILLFGFLWGLSTKVNHPFGLTLLHDRLYWTDWQTDAVYRADVNTGANTVLMTGNLGKPMDIHAYSAIPKQQQKLYYTFSFPNNKGSNFTCISSTSCPQIDAPPQCPPGYKEVRENKTCGLYCRDIVGYTWRCPCKDWMSCAVKERYLWGCSFGYYSSFRVRECVQDVKPGRCPGASVSQGSQNSCFNDTDCPNTEKCCNLKCKTPLSIDNHPCQQNNGGCDQLCFGVPGGHKCGCENGFYYNETQSKCVLDTRPTTVPPTSPPFKSCTPHPAPEHGSVTCDGDPVPDFGGCYFTCDPGYELIGFSWDFCFGGSWFDPPPTCNRTGAPLFSFCPNNTYFPTEPGKSYATVSWSVPTATDKYGASVSVQIIPIAFTPPVRLEVGEHTVKLMATDADGEFANCTFKIIIEDREPPSFGSSCPSDIILYTGNDFSIRLPSHVRSPVATDNVKAVVRRTGYPRDDFFPVGVTIVTYTAIDAAGLNASCVHNVTVVDVCLGVRCLYGAQCAVSAATGNSPTCICNIICPVDQSPVCGSDGQTYSSECHMNSSACSSQRALTVVSRGACSPDEDCSPKVCTNGEVCSVVGGKAVCSCNFTCTEIYDPVCGSDIKTYDNECKMRVVACRAKTSITVHVKGRCDDCGRLNCDYGSTCKIVKGEAKCECDFSCSGDTGGQVCGSDGRTYNSNCALMKEKCAEKREITVVKNSACNSGCPELNLNTDVFRNSSTINCDNSLKCKITCKNGYNAAIPEFLNLQCYGNKWIRQNKESKYVVLAEATTPPRCYTPTSQPCATGFALTHTVQCVPCPPGSFYVANSTSCVPCEVTKYQDESGKTSCKSCTSPMTSTTTGAESCYFNHGTNAVKMTFNEKQSEITQDKIRNDIAYGLTYVCKTTNCDFDDNAASRKRRDASTYTFSATHIIILDVTGVSETVVTIFVLDPTSTSPLPDKAFSSDNLRKLILTMQQNNLVPYTLKSVDEVGPPQASSKSESTSKAPVIAGVIIAIIVLIGIIFAIWMYNRRRKNKNTIPPVQFNSAGEGGTHIGQPTPVVSNPQYENPEAIRDGLHHGFVNQVYNDIHSPPPYYESPTLDKPAAYETPHNYETPDGQEAGALPTKEKLPDDAVVDVLPPKEVEKPIKADSPMKFFHKRGTIPNAYEVTDVPKAQRSATPEDEAEMRLEPPPKFNDAKLQVMRENAASSILPNVPRKKKVNPVDGNANDTTGDEGSSQYQNVGNVTHEQSET